jgi:hypothetical protein
MKLMEVLNESVEDRMIAKAKTVYKVYKKGRGKVRSSWTAPIDLSYELPDMDKCLFQVRPSWDDRDDLMVVITMFERVKYKIHNLDELGDGLTEKSILKQYVGEIEYVYRKKFDQFGIAIGENS